MLAYVLRRLLWMVLVVWVITVITFLLSHVIPADPAAAAALSAAPPTGHAWPVKVGLQHSLLTPVRDLKGLVFPPDLGTRICTRRRGADIANYPPATLEPS